MEQFYVFIIRNDIWIYFLCGLGIFWYAFQLWQARRLLRQAMFGLERERGQGIQRTAVVVLFILLAIVAGITYVNLEVAPTLPPEILRPPTPTPNIFATSFAPPVVQGTPRPDRTPTLAVAPTVTLRGGSNDGIFTDIETLTPTPVPTLPAVTEACNNQVDITSPPANITAQGPVTFFGTATDANFGAYDLQALGPQTNGEWQSLLETPATTPIQDNILGRFNFGNWQTGDYLVRILVTNPGGEEVGQCGIQITVLGSG